MKNIMSTKDNNYSLKNGENYKETLNGNINDVIKIYGEIIIDYLKLILEKIKIKQNEQLLQFIIIRGLDTITHVFFHILYFTKNIELTYYHSQKSYYFYIEFVSQISDDEKMFLQLTSRDAVTYVYKKTVFDITNEFKKSYHDISCDFKDDLDLITKIIYLYQIYLLKIIKSRNISLLDVTNASKVYEKINIIVNKNNIFILEKLTEKLYNIIADTGLFYEITTLLFKKLVKKSELIYNVGDKLASEDFEKKINNISYDKFTNWILTK